MGAEVKTMEIKKPQQSVLSEQVLPTKRVKEFVEEIKSEVHKITWTSRDELLVYTKIVIGATFACGMSIYLLDLLIQGTLASLNFLLSFISG